MRVARTKRSSVATRTLIVNLMPVEVPLIDDRGVLTTYPAKANPVQLKTTEMDATGVVADGYSLSKVVVREILNLPPMTDNTIFLVPVDVLIYCRGRTDIFTPDTEDGVIYNGKKVVCYSKLKSTGN